MQAAFIPEEELSGMPEPILSELQQAETPSPEKPKETAAEEGPSPETAPEEDSEQQELQELWGQAFEKAVARKASLKLLATDIRAVARDEESFTVQVSSTLKKNMLVQSGELFEDCLEEVTGQRLKLKAEMGGNPEDRKKQMQTTLSQLEELLGPGKVKIKE